MSDVEKVQEKVEEYCGLYRISPAFELSELYDLQSDWRENKEFPFARDKGCYVFYSDKHELLYIGKASQRNTLGSRIASYFRWDLSRTYIEPRHTGWTFPPAMYKRLRRIIPLKLRRLKNSRS